VECEEKATGFINRGNCLNRHAPIGCMPVLYMVPILPF
jgi:hypothetical protein